MQLEIFARMRTGGRELQFGYQNCSNLLITGLFRQKQQQNFQHDNLGRCLLR